MSRHVSLLMICNKTSRVTTEGLSHWWFENMKLKTNKDVTCYYWWLEQQHTGDLNNDMRHYWWFEQRHVSLLMIWSMSNRKRIIPTCILSYLARWFLRCIKNSNKWLSWFLKVNPNWYTFPNCKLRTTRRLVFQKKYNFMDMMAVSEHVFRFIPGRKHVRSTWCFLPYMTLDIYSLISVPVKHKQNKKRQRYFDSFLMAWSNLQNFCQSLYSNCPY